MKTDKKLFLVKQKDSDNSEFWVTYPSLEAAVHENNERTDIYEADVKLLGKFKKTFQLVKQN